MITLLLFYVLPALISLLLWVSAGWKFSLSAAPEAYRLAEARNAEISKVNVPQRRRELKSEIEQRDVYLLSNGTTDAWYNYHTNKDKLLNSKMEAYQEQNPSMVAANMGKKCLRRGPFAYFLTPAWQYKIEANWFPVEVNVMRMQAGANSTLKRLESMNEGDRETVLAEIERHLELS